MDNGDMYIISPALPKNFSVLKEFGNFESILKIKNNWYVKYEPSIEAWHKSIIDNILPVSQNLRKTYVSLPNLIHQNFIGVPQGPIKIPQGPIKNEHINKEYSQIFCLHSANPIVLLLKLKNGSLTIIIGFGDISPSFSEKNEANINLNIYEEIEFNCMNGLISVYDEDKLYYLCNGSLYQISFPWLPQIKECIHLEKTAKDLKQSVVKELVSDILGSSIALINHRIRFKYALVGMDKGTKKIDLKFIREKGEFFNLEVSELDVKLPKDSFEENKNIPPPQSLTIDIPEISNEEQVLAALTLVVDKIYENFAVPLSKKAAFLNARVQECIEIYDKLKENAGSINYVQVQELSKTIDSLSQKMQFVEKNASMINDRIDRILEKHQKVNIPISTAEKELRIKLINLEKTTNMLKSIAKSVIII